VLPHATQPPTTGPRNRAHPTPMDEEEAYGRDLYHDLPIPVLEPDPDGNDAEGAGAGPGGVDGEPFDENGGEARGVDVKIEVEEAGEKGEEDENEEAEEEDLGNEEGFMGVDEDEDPSIPALEPDDSLDNQSLVKTEHLFESEAAAPRKVRGDQDEKANDLRHPFQRHFQPPPNFFPRKKFTCDVPAPSVDELQSRLEAKMQIDQKREEASAQLKADLEAKVDDAKKILGGKLFLGSETLEGKELSAYNDDIDAHYAAIQNSFIQKKQQGDSSNVYMPKEKVERFSGPPGGPSDDSKNPFASLCNDQTDFGEGLFQKANGNMSIDELHAEVARLTEALTNSEDRQEHRESLTTPFNRKRKG